MIKKTFQILLYSSVTIIFIMSALYIFYLIHAYKSYLLYKQKEAEANIILTGDKLAECIANACPIAGCKTQEDWKIAYYKMFGKNTACAVALYKTKQEYLNNVVPYPRHKKCYRRSKTKFFNQDGLDYKKLKAQYLTTKKLPKIKSSNIFKIPRKLNFVWFTSEKEFKFKKNHFFKINTYLFHNTKITPKWQHTLWTNNIAWITDDAKQKLKSSGIDLRSIDEINMTDPKHKALRDLAKKYAAQHKWGLSSDIARDLVEYYEGGIYVDGDYQILEPAELEKYMKSYKSFFGINDLTAYYNVFEVINAFIASEPKGTVLKKKLDLTYRNTINIVNAPNYIKYPCSQTQEVLSKTGPMALTIAFALVEKKDSDVLLPYCTLFRIPKRDFFTCLNIPEFGKHYFHGGWIKKHPITKQFIY